MRRAVVLLVLPLLVLPPLLVGGCADPDARTGPGGPATFDEARDRADQLAQARAALDRWAAAARGGPAFIPVGSQTGQVGDWERDVGAAYKLSLLAGAVVVTAELPSGVPPQGEIRWDDAQRRAVDLVAAAEAIERLKQDGSGKCPECTPIEVTGARLATATLSTSRGPATVPVWEYSVKGSAVRIWRVAVAAAVPSPGPHDPNRPPAGLSAERVTIRDKTLTAHFIGARGPATEPCGADYTAEVVTSDVAVVLLINVRSYQPPAGQADNYGCDLVGYAREASVELAEPLGDRVVLEVRYGTAVPVTKD